MSWADKVDMVDHELDCFCLYLIGPCYIDTLLNNPLMKTTILQEIQESTLSPI